uniref:Uncharacterized protein n=1 Tax=Anguilla anguilla TaxID=7936 RepID=A0A0E9T484_ANGAN
MINITVAVFSVPCHSPSVPNPGMSVAQCPRL